MTINNNAILQASGDTKTGSIVDIDTFIDQPIPNFFEDYSNILK
jgi:hypothetical protein